MASDNRETSVDSDPHVGGLTTQATGDGSSDFWAQSTLRLGSIQLARPLSDGTLVQTQEVGKGARG